MQSPHKFIHPMIDSTQVVNGLPTPRARAHAANSKAASGAIACHHNCTHAVSFQHMRMNLCCITTYNSIIATIS